jgi:hypothetical protein
MFNDMAADKTRATGNEHFHFKMPLIAHLSAHRATAGGQQTSCPIIGNPHSRVKSFYGPAAGLGRNLTPLPERRTPIRPDGDFFRLEPIW